jgi:hypothetical protein
LPLPITAAISTVLPSAIAVAVGHCCLRHQRPLQSPSPMIINVTVAIGHCQELLPWHSKNCI